MKKCRRGRRNHMREGVRVSYKVKEGTRSTQRSKGRITIYSIRKERATNTYYYACVLLSNLLISSFFVYFEGNGAQGLLKNRKSGC